MSLREKAASTLAQFRGDPEGLAELAGLVREELHKQAQPKPRTEMDPAERLALCTESSNRKAAHAATNEKLNGEASATEKEQEAMRKKLQRLREALTDNDRAYCAWRDPVMARLWAERPELADELVARTDTEARSLRNDHYVLPPRVEIVGPRGKGELVSAGESGVGNMARMITNSETVEARRKALFALADSVRQWTTCGKFGTTAELQRLFDDAYAALPKVEALHDVLRRDVRGHEVLGRTWPSSPPAA